MRLLGCWLLPLALLACGGNTDEEPPPPGPEGGGGAAPSGCEVSDTLVDGLCLPPGVPADGCGQGFEADGTGSCSAILPAAICPDGQMALPGETVCRPVAPCGAGPWGDIPLEADSVFVDASAAPGGDGSESAPYDDLLAAIAAAPAGAHIAIAEGSYPAGADLQKPLRIWGRCPELVELVSPPGNPALLVFPAGDGTEVHTLAVTGGDGIIMTGTIPITLDRLWIHDTTERAIGAEDTLGDVELLVTGTLVERAAGYGIYISGAAAEIVDSEFRDTQIFPAYGYGRGVYAIANASTGDRATASLRHSVVDRGREVAVACGGCDLLLEDSLIRDTLPDDTGDLGRAIVQQMEPDTLELGNVTLRRSVVERSREIGIFTGGGTLVLEDSVVRDTLPSELDGSIGWGLSLQPTLTMMLPSTAALTRSTIERNQEIAVAAIGANLQMVSSLVRDTGPGLRGFGRAVHLQVDLDFGGVPSTGVIDHCAFLDNADVAFTVNAADLVMTFSLIARTAAAPKDFPIGDGLALFPLAGPASGAISDSEIRDSERAGIAVFSSALTLANTRLSCNAFDLNTEDFEGLGAPQVTDGGGNDCRCGDVERDCKAVSAGLVPPSGL